MEAKRISITLNSFHMQIPNHITYRMVTSYRKFSKNSERTKKILTSYLPLDSYLCLFSQVKFYKWKREEEAGLSEREKKEDEE